MLTGSLALVKQIQPSSNIALSSLEEMTPGHRHCQPSNLATSIGDGGFLQIEDSVSSSECDPKAGDQHASVGPDPIRDSDYAQGPPRSGGTIETRFKYPPDMSLADTSETGVSDSLLGSSQWYVHWATCETVSDDTQFRFVYLMTMKTTAIAMGNVRKKQLNERNRRHRR